MSSRSTKERYEVIAEASGPRSLLLGSERLHCVYQGEISTGQDALTLDSYGEADAIITNPPYARSLNAMVRFIGVHWLPASDTLLASR